MQSADQHLAPDDARGVHVTALVDRFAAALFGGGVVVTAHSLPESGDLIRLRVGRFGDAEVGDDQPTVGRDDEIARLQITVDDAMAVDAAQPFEQFDHHRAGVVRGEYRLAMAELRDLA